MTSYTNINGLRLMVTGADSGTWGDNTNVNLQMLDAATKGVKEISLSGTTHTLTTTDGTLSDANYAVLVFTGSPSGTNTVTINPNDQTKLFFIQNNSGQSVVMTQGSGGNATVANGKAAIVYADGGGAVAQVVDLTSNFGDFLVASNNLSDLDSASTARTNLGLGTIATQNSNSVSITGGSVSAAVTSSNATITGGSVSGITDLAIADGGTGASTASAARSNLGVAIGSDVQAYDADLTALGGLAKTDGNFIVGNGTTWTAESGATARASLGLTIGTDVLAYDSNLQSFVSTFTLPTTDGSANYVLATNGSGTLSFVETGSGDGSVTSVGLSGGTTGLTVSGSPITSFGTMTLGGTLALASGGTGSTTASGARTNLGLGSIATQASSSVSITGGSISGITDLAIADGGTGASTASAARTNLGVAIGSDVQAYDADLTALAGLAKTDGNIIVGNGSTWVAESGATARTSLGIGSIATQDNSSINITGGSITGITDLAVADGGTGASTASQARTNLGLAIGSDVQAYDADLTALGGLSKADGNFIVGNGASWTVENGSTARASLGLVIGSDVQAYDADLTTWGGVTRATGFDAFVTSPTSVNFKALVTGETGSGAVVFGTAPQLDSPTLTTPVLGTPSSGNLSNCTGTPTLNLSNSTADGTNEVGFRNIPPVGTKTTSYTLATGDVGKYVQVGSGGSITIPDATFSEGDVVSIFNNTSGNITITCSITTAYIAGNDLDKASVTLATRGVATILFISGTICVMSGNIS